MLSVLASNEYCLSRRAGGAVIQRSRGCPYLWIKVCRSASGYLPGITCSSICRIAWGYRSLVRKARSQLQDEVLSLRVHSENDEEQEED